MKKYTLVNQDNNLSEMFIINNSKPKSNLKIVQKKSNVIRLTRIGFDPNNAA